MKIIRVARVFSEIRKVQKQISQSNLTQNAVDSWFNRLTSDDLESQNSLSHDGSLGRKVDVPTWMVEFLWEQCS